MSILDALIGYQGDHPKDVAKAYADLNRSIARDVGTKEEQQWREFFDAVKLNPGANVAPENFQPAGMSEMERWKSQIDGLITSGNPVLQEEGLNMLSQYRQRATAPTGNQPAMSTAGKMATEIGLTPGTPEFESFVREYAFNKPKAYAPKYVTPAEAKSIQWVDKNRTEPLVGQNWEDIRGKVRKVDNAAEMRDNAMAVIGSLEKALFDPEIGIYNDEVWQDEGVAGVVKGGIAGALQDLTQTDTRYKSYSDVRAGTAAQIIRAMGEKGALSDKDIDRALALLPNISGFRGMPDLPETAQRKVAFLKTILRIDPKEWGPLLEMAEAEGLLEERETESVPQGDLPPGAVGVAE